MKIKHIRVIDLDIPVVPPSSTQRTPSWNEKAPRGSPMGMYPEWRDAVPGGIPGFGGRQVWVQVVADNGAWGLGRCSFGEPVEALITSHFAPLLEGRDALATEYLNDLMWRSTKRFGSLGLSAVAMSGIDIALWDLKGKIMDQPVWRLLGGPSRDAISLYATGDDLDWSQELGFTAFKITNPAHFEMGIAGINLVEEKVATARDTVGRDHELMINPVMSYDVEFTIRLAERLRPYELRWLEEPLIPEDIEGHIQLKNAITWIPIATGEDHHTRIPFRQLIEHRAVDVVQPDISWCGGLSEAIKIYTLAQAFGIKTVPHGGANTPWGQHFAYAMPESSMTEYWLGTAPGIPLDEVRPIPGMVMPVNGKITPTDAPGFGMEILESQIIPRR
jgi:L-rhamnonate dehydratase